MNRRELFKVGAVLAAAPAMSPQAATEISSDMREFIRLQGWTCIDDAVPPEGVLVSMARADGALGMFIGTARRYGSEYHCEQGETGVMLGIESAPHGWALYPAPIKISAHNGGVHLIASDEGTPYVVRDGEVSLASPI